MASDKDDFSARVAARQTKPRRINRAAFIAHLPQIEKAIADGQLLISVWEHLRAEQKIAFGYDSFRRFARQLLSKTAFDRSEQRKRKKTKTTSTAPSSKERGFRMQPAKPEDLF